MRLIAGSFAILLALLPTAALPSGADGLKDAPSARARAIGITFSRCAVRQERQAVVDFLFDPFGTNDPTKLAKALPSACLDIAIGHPVFGPSKLNTSALLMRGLLFEALYAHDFRKVSPHLQFDGIAPLHYDVAGVDAAGQPMRRDYRALMKIGDCAARKAPEKVRALLGSTATSAAENGAIADLHDVWIDCLPGHRELPFSVEMMRATLSEPFYRLMKASEQA
jgi:hypothetical protein